MPRLPRHGRPALFLIVASLIGTGAAQGQQPQPSPGEQALKYRKALYDVMVWNFQPLAAMAQGKKPYDAAEFALRAERVAEIPPMLSEAYPPESKDVTGSKLKPVMWENRADFDAKLKTLVDRTAQLASIAKGGNFEQSKAAWIETANACKACHEKYRAD